MADDTILVPAEMPATPLVLADAKFLVTLAGVERRVAELRVTDAKAAQEAATLLRRLTDAGTGIETTREELKRPFLDIGRKIDSIARGVAGRIDKSKTRLRTLLADWNTQEQQRLADEERRRQAELAALEAKRVAEEAAEAARVAALVAATPPADMLDLDFDGQPEPPKTETEQKIESLKYAPVIAAAKPTGVRFVVSLRFKVTDLRALPDDFKVVMADEQKIRGAFCVGYREGAPLPVVPGVEFSVQKSAISTGRDEF